MIDDCCTVDHVRAIAPWTCKCYCHEIQDAPQEKHRKCLWCGYPADYLTVDQFCSSECREESENWIEPTSETYDQGSYIIVQDDDGYIAHIYHTSEGDWEIEETILTYLGRD